MNRHGKAVLRRQLRRDQVAAFFMPAALDRPCGRLDIKNPATTATTASATSPFLTLNPIISDSGMPSSSAPMGMASPLPGASFSLGCRTHPPQRLR